MEKIHKFDIKHGDFIGKPFPVPGKADHFVFSYAQLNSSLVIVDFDLSSNRCMILKEWPMHRIPNHDSLFSFVYKKHFYLIGDSFGTKLNLEDYTLSNNISHCKLAHMKLRRCYTIATKDNVRIITQNKLYEYNIEMDICSELLGDLDFSPKCPQLLSFPLRNELFIFGALYTRKIFKQHANEPTVWHLMQDVEMPFDRWQHNGFQCIVAFDNVVFGFSFADDESKSIWCLDMIGMKWSKSSVQIPAEIFNYLCYGQASLLKYNQMLCFFKLGQGHLYQINMHDILSKDVINSHRRHSAPLIKGYVSELERKMEIRPVPLPLQHLIIHFFPF